MRTLKWMVVSTLILAACDMPPSPPRNLIPANTFIGADKQQFYFMYESGAAYNFVNQAPKSREDAKEINASPQMRFYIQSGARFEKAQKTGQMIRTEAPTRCEVIQTFRFEGTRLFPGEFFGSQVRLLEGPHKGFEGWLYDHQVIASHAGGG
jgi:hypothetical protein